MRNILILVLFSLVACGNGSTTQTMPDASVPDSTHKGECTSDRDCAHLAVSACEKGVCNAEHRCVIQALDQVPCDDHNACTRNDTCIRGLCKGTAFTCPAPKDQCKVAGDCDPQKGCVVQDAPDGTPCDDQDPCTDNDVCRDGVCQGTAKTCDDGLKCTSDACSSGSCVSTPQEGWCVIDGKCYKTGDASQDDPCKYCDPGKTQKNWSDRPQGYKPGNGVVCQGGSACTPDCTDKECGDDGCGGSCWTGQGAECNDDLDCTTDRCNNGKCGHDLVTDHCLIDGKCVAKGQTSQKNPCLACDPAKDQHTWSPMPDRTQLDFGKVCYQGKVCTPDCTGKKCGSDGCGGTCGTCGSGTCCKVGKCVSPFLWAVDFGVKGSDRPLDIVRWPGDMGDGVVVGGVFSDGELTGTFAPPRGDAGYAEFFDSNGNIMNTVSVDDKDPNTYYAQNVCCMAVSQDHLYLAGRVEKNLSIDGTAVLTDSDSMTSYIASMDKDLSLKWVHVLGTTTGHSTGDNTLRGLYWAQKDLLLTGDFETFISYGTTTLTSTHSDIFGIRIKTDTTGVSAGAFGGSDDMYGILRPDTGSGYWLIGGFSGTFSMGGSSFTASGDSDAILARVNQGMGVVMAQASSSPGATFVIGSALSPTGSLFVSGIYTKAFTYHGHKFTGHSGFDSMLMAFDKNGNLKWTRDMHAFWGGMFHDHQNVLPLLYFGDDGNLWLLGSGANSADLGCGPVGPHGPGMTMVVVRLDPASGKCLGQKVLARGPDIDSGVIPAGMVINDGVLYITGELKAKTQFDTQDLEPHKDSTGAYNWDSFLAAYDLACMEAVQ